jgi:hypothetical protein
VLSVLGSVLAAKVGIRNGKGSTARSLARMGPAFVAHYLDSTVARADRPITQPWWVCAGNPSVLCEYGEEELSDLPRHSSNIVAFEFQHLDIAHCYLEYESVPIGVWFLRRGKNASVDELRRLRLNLARVHEEQETTRILLELLASRRLNFNSASSDALQDFIERMLGALETKSRFGIAQQPLLEAAREVTDVVDPAARALLLQSLGRIRIAVRNKIERRTRPIVHAQVVNVIENVESMTNQTTKVVLGNNNTITGPFTVVTAETIQNSFNSIAKSDTKEELKESLKQLTVQVAELAKLTPPEKAEEIARDLESFTKEATSKAPRKKWYELSADGLLEAAKTVAEMAAPVTTAVKAVLALLA